jgi:putative membrane protein
MKTIAAKFCGRLVMGVCLAGAPAMLVAQGNMGGSMSHSPDSKFAMEAAHGGQAEVELGKLAQEKGSSQAVKDFGQLMVHDHSEANQKLMAVAEQEKMQLPGSPDAKQQAIYDKLSKLSGSAFDKAYMHDMLKDHEEDIKAFKKESMTGTDPQIKNFAAETLPVIEGHLAKAKTIESQMGAATGSM